MLQSMECINTSIIIYEMFDNKTHLLNMLLEGRPDLTDSINDNGETLY